MNPQLVRHPRWFIALLCVLLASVGAVVMMPTSESEAAVRNPFTPVYSSNENGAIAIVGNSQMSCVTDSSGCATARSTASGLNNNVNMQFIDQDAVTTTTNSTSADLELPAGSTVLNARLIWGGRTVGGTGGVPALTPLNRALFRTPASSAYTTLNGTLTEPTLSSGDFGPYQASIDVTSAVQAAGSGTYWVADIRGATGQDRYAGWSLVVAYRNPALPLRNLTVFEGFADVNTTQGNSTVSIPISGFRTPNNGTVNATVGVLAWEGDSPTTGDTLRFNNTVLSDAARPANNFFDSRISALGSTTAARNPNYLNTLGVDMGTVAANGILTNNQTSTSIVVDTAGDFYYPGLFTTQIDLYSPRFPEVTKSVVNLNGNTPARPGDVLEYTASFPNSGGDSASNVLVRDPLPANTTYVPGSMRIVDGANAGAKSDAGGDDQADYLAGSRTVQFRLGSGASASTGGTIAPGETSSVRFRVTVDRAASGTSVANTALLDYRAVTLGNDFTFTGNTVRTPVADLADLAITKTARQPSQAAGSQITWDLAVTNNGPNAASSVVVTDTLPAGTSFVSAAPPSGTCTASGGTVTCRVPTIANGATVTIPVVATIDPGSTATSIVNQATVSAATADDVLTNNIATAATPLTRSADLAVTKTGPATARSGERISWTVAVTNNGPSSASDAVLTDQLPSGVSFVSASATGAATCTNSNSQVTCSLGSLAPGATRTATIVGLIDSGVPASTLTNTATASSTTADPRPADNRATAQTTVTPGADLRVTKVATDATVVAGGRARFAITVTNAGPSDAADVTLADPAVAGLTLDLANPSQGTCTITDGDAACDLGRIGAGATVTVQVAGEVASSTTASTITNVATAATTTDQSDTGNDSGSATVDVTTSADLSLTKTASPDPAVAGSPLTYTLTVSNAGPSAARGVVVTDSLPADVTFTSSPDGCTAAGAEVTCAVGTLASGATRTLRVIVDVDPDAEGRTFTNSAVVDATTPDPATDNNTAAFTSASSGLADVSLTKTTSPTPLVAGSPVTYTLTARNAGPSTATGIEIVDTIPQGITVTGATINGTGGTCTRTATTVTCTAPSLAVGDAGQRVVTITGTVAATATGTSTNSATVSARTPDDPTASNNTATSTAPIREVADVGVTLNGPTAPVRAGDTADYQLVVVNNGPSVARDVVITGQVPPNLTPVLGSTDGACEVIGRTVRCVLPQPLPPGAVLTIPLEARVDSNAPAGDIPGTASISTSADDQVPANNSSTHIITIVREADLAITKSVTPRPLVAGSTATYTLTATNTGPSDADAVVITDTVPAGLTVQTANTTAGTCTVTGSTVRCPVGVLPAQARATVTVQVLVDPAATGTVTNAAAVSSDTPDPDGDDTTATVTTPITVAADLRLIKTARPDPVAAGSVVTWTLSAVNAGPSVARAVTLTDQIPAGTVLLPGGIAAGPGADCSASTATTVSCTLGDLAPNATITVILSAQLDSALDDGSTITNTATLDSPTPPVSDDDARTGSATSTVRSTADLAITKGALLDPPTAGGTQRYLLTVVNNGPSASRGAVVTDRLPAGVTFVASDDADCNAEGQVVECALGTLAPGQIVSLSLDVSLSRDLAGSRLENTATVSSTTTDPTSGNDSATHGSAVAGASDLVLTKTVTSGPVVAGQPITYQLSVRNAGPSNARTVRIVDPLPAGVDYVSAVAGDGGSCTETAVNSVPTVTCTWDALEVGARTLSATITVAVPATTPVGTTFTNVATATSSNPDPDPAPASVESVVQGRADLGVTKRLLGAAVAGQPVSWLVTVTNNGPSDATDVTLTDPQVTGVVFTAAQTPAGNCTVAATRVDCALGTVPSRGSVAITITGDLASGATGDLVNSASVTSDVPDPDSDNDSATIRTPIDAAANLRITKSADPASAVAGSRLDYLLSVTNDGPSTARDLAIADQLPAGYTATAAAFDSPAGAGSCTVAATVECELASLDDGATAVVRITGTVGSDVTAASLTNAATVRSATPDPDPTDNRSEIPTVVDRAADLVVTGRGPDSVTAGNAVRYEFDVRNDGPSVARGSTLVFDLPAALTGVVATVGGQPCTVEGGRLTCPLGDLAADAVITVVLTGTVDQNTTDGFEVAAAASSSTTELQPADNRAAVSTGVTTAADLQITKTARDDSFTSGERASWIVEVRNAGPSLARSTVVDDVLPAGLSQVTATASSGVCTVSNDRFSCDLGDLGAPATVTIEVSALVAPGYSAATVVNTASVNSSTTDPTPDDRSDTSTTPVAASADLRIGKRAVGTVGAGQPVTFEIEVVNDGPSEARDIVITDVLPSDVTGASATLPGGTCSVDGDEVSCTAGAALAPSDTLVMTVTGRLSAGSDGTLTNRASVVSSTPDPDDTDNSTRIDLDPEISADVSVTKQGPASVFAGGPISWTVTVANDGPADARSVQVVDTLPAGVGSVEVDDEDCTVDAGQILCNFATLAADADRTLTISGTVDSGSTADSLSNSVVVTSADPDPDSTDNRATATSAVLRSADVAVTKVAEPSAFVAGGTGRYRITVANTGPSDATAVTLVDELPAGIVLDQAPEAGTGTCTVVGQRISCELGTVAAGTDRVVEIPVRVPSSVTDTTIENSATASTPTPDSDPDNDTGSVSTPIDRVADLTVTKTAPDTVLAGEPMSWQVRLTNDGPSSATDVVLVDDLPAGIGPVEVTSSLGACTRTADRLECTIGTVAARGVVTIDISVIGGLPADTPTGTLTNSVTVTSPTDDVPTAPGEDDGRTDSVSTRVDASADLVVAKVPNAASFTAGGVASWTITVHNNGPSVAREVTITDQAPAGISDLQLSGPSGVECTGASCTLAELAPGSDQDVVLTATGTVPADSTATSITNRVVVDSATPDPVEGDNSASSQVPVSASAGLAIVKTADRGRAVAGEAISWTLTVTNSGPSLARGVIVNDVLPAGLGAVEVDSPAGVDCTTGATIECTIGTLAVGDDLQIVVSGTLAADYDGDTVANRATVSSDTPDPDSSDDSSTSEVGVDTRADLVVTKTGPAQVLAGNRISWTISVGNEGPSVARAVVLQDAVPAGVGSLDIPEGAPCTIEGQQLRCDLGDLEPGADPIEIEISGVVAADFGATTLSNTATASSGTTEVRIEDNSATSETTVGASADLSVTKRLVSDLVAGRPATWEITVVNDGPSTAAGVVVSDDLPVGTALLEAPGCSETDGTVTCAAGSLTAGARVTFRVVLEVSSAARGDLTNVATVSSTTTDPDLEDNRAVATDPVGRIANLGVTKTADRANLTEGDIVTWTIRVTNAGPSDASEVSVAENWPEDVRLVSAEASVGRYDEDSRRWQIGDLADGASAELTLRARVTGQGPVLNTVRVTSQTTDPVEVDDTDAVEVVVTGVEGPSPSPDPTGTATPPPTGGGPGPGLGDTGGPVLGVLVMGAVLMLGGGALLGVRGRRRGRH